MRMGKRFYWMRLLLVVSCVAIIGGSIAGSAAWLTSEDDVKNDFVPGVVGCQVIEKTEGAAKSSIMISNMYDANVPAYIRVALVPVWRTAEGNGTGKEAFLPEISLGANWAKSNDGYYYYTLPVQPGKTTGELLKAPIAGQTSDEGYIFEVQVLAQSIQADGMNGEKPVVETIWTNVTVGTDSERTLSVR